MKTLWCSLALMFAASSAVAAPTDGAREADAVFADFKFGSGETLPQLKLHYTTLGSPHRNARGEIDNAILILHGTGGSGKQFFRPQFADMLYGPGQPLDITRYFIILPDNIGHGASSKPSDGLKMAFPKYDYDDMVRAQYQLVTQTLGIKQLQLILGTSMGCMHAFVWGTTYPGAAARLAPFACNAMPIAGRNRWWRKMSIDAIKADPAWQNGNYTTQPAQGLRTADVLGVIAGANPLALQTLYPTRDAADQVLASVMAARAASSDANDTIYQLDSSRNYDPSPALEKITVPVLWINSADDFINPPELGAAEQAAKRMPKARFILIPPSAETKGHGTHSWAKFWATDLANFLAK